ncbi:hypothetical protein TNIN_100741 [Trichonephila inaurata madagascariensis]|uniref:Uncharacterized protein n=1 Tax=Trichonephila inaurata madagascariensis TaxID=2747483 RepID=A0A8X6WVL3_9ARAC|nr:hypothetical protein TNIN_100741 [Trichonephila inaurata madagascariensis]
MKKKRVRSYITPAGLIFLIRRFEETESLQNQPRSGAPRLSEVCTSSVVSQMNNTSRELSTRGVPVYSRQEFAQNTDISNTSVFRILHSVLQLYPYKLQSLQQLMPNDAAK